MIPPHVRQARDDVLWGTSAIRGQAPELVHQQLAEWSRDRLLAAFIAAIAAVPHNRKLADLWAWCDNRTGPPVRITHPKLTRRLPKGDRDQMIAALTRAGMSLNEIAARVGMTQRGVAYARKRIEEAA